MSVCLTAIILAISPGEHAVTHPGKQFFVPESGIAQSGWKRGKKHKQQDKKRQSQNEEFSPHVFGITLPCTGMNFAIVSINGSVNGTGQSGN